VLRHEERNGMFTVFAGCTEQIELDTFITWLCTPIFRSDGSTVISAHNIKISCKAREVRPPLAVISVEDQDPVRRQHAIAENHTAV
jgi:hypothetical protein